MSLFSYNSTSKTASTGMKYTFGTNQSDSKTSNETTSAPTSNSSAKMNQFDYAPKRFGVKYDPPTISKLILILTICLMINYISPRVPYTFIRKTLPS